MSKLTLSTLASLTNQTSAINLLNNNATAIQNAFDNTLSRDGTSPNSMSTDFDMNQYRILNLPAPVSADEPARKIDIINGVGQILIEVQGATVLPVATRVALAAVSGGLTPNVYLSESGRQGIFNWSPADNSANVTNDPSQGVFVPPNRDPTGASGAWVRQYSDGVHANWFGAQGDGVTNDITALTSAASTAHYLSVPLVLVETPNGYLTQSTWDLGYNFLTIYLVGNPRIVHRSGVANAIAVRIDAGTGASSFITSVQMVGGYLTIDGDSNTQYGYFERGAIHSNIRIRVKNGGTTAAFLVNFGVLNVYDLICSSNQSAFTTAPLDAMVINQRNAGEPASVCKYRLKFEGIPRHGLILDYGDRCEFEGTIEGCGGMAVQEGTPCNQNKFTLDMEDNCRSNAFGTVYGAYFAGTQTILENMVETSYSGTISSVTRYATYSVLLAGRLQRVVNSKIRLLRIDSSASNTVIENSTWNDAPNLGGLSDGSTTTRLTNGEQEGTSSVTVFADYKPVPPLFTISTFTNSWVDPGGAFAGAGYSKSPDGLVKLHGNISSGTVGSAAFTLPAGYRPTVTTGFACINTTTGTVSYVQVGSGGTVTVVTGTNESISLENVSFYAGE